MKMAFVLAVDVVGEVSANTSYALVFLLVRLICLFVFFSCYVWRENKSLISCGRERYTILYMAKS